MSLPSWQQRLKKRIGQPNQDPLMIFMHTLERAGTEPARNMTELRQQNHRASSGLAFEEFGVRYCLHVLGLTRCWRLPNVPIEILKSLGLRRQDMGIDLIGFDDKDRAYAIQCRYRRRRTGRTTVLSWRSLATFFALANTTGPYHQWVVLTTADYVRRAGRRTKHDRTIGYGSLKRISNFQWLAICSDDVKQKITKPIELPDQALIRKRRLAYLFK